MNSSSRDLAGRLSDYALSLAYDTLPAEAINEAKRRTLDTIGCAIAAFGAEPVRISRMLALDINSKTRSATLLGTGDQTSLDMAAFVNVAMARDLDFNDGYHGKVGTGHISDNIPVCLSVADFRHATGRDFLLSVVMAYEVHVGFADLTDMFKCGWDYTCLTLISSSLAASKLMGLSSAATAEALSITLNAHIPLRQVRRGELSMWKSCSAAEAARCAVFSSMLAAEGMTGPRPIFEGEFGFFKQITGPLEVDIGSFGKDGKFGITKPYFKLFPADGRVQGGIWAAIQMRKKIRNLGDIEKIEIRTSHRTFIETSEGQMKWTPQTRESADHSLPYTVAVALADGAVTRASFGDGRRGDPKIAGLIRKMKVTEDPALTAVYLEKESDILKIHLSSGEQITEVVEYPRGHPNNPVTDKELEEKFRQNVDGYMSNSQAEEVIGMIWKIDGLKDVATLVEACRIDPAS